MAMEPITLFARIANPAAVAVRLRELVPGVELDGPDATWKRAVIVFPSGGGRRKLTLTHDPGYYAEPNWSRQMSGMRGYFSRFPDTERKPRVMMLTTCLHFSLGTLFEPDFEPNDDPRLDVLFEVAQLLDGVLFTPSSLRDAHGRILFGTGGEDEEDPDATWPRVAAEVSLSDPLGAAAHESSRPQPGDKAVENSSPPTPGRVARRALAMTAVTVRAILEQEAASREAAKTYQKLVAWTSSLAIDEELEPDEWEVLQRPLGRLDQRAQINSTWRLEGLVVLAWALGRMEIPPHDKLVQTNRLWRGLGFLDGKAATALLANPTLRSREEIGILRNRLFAQHWRLRNFHIRPEVMDFAAYARTCWFGPLDVSGLPLVDGDLGLRGKRIDRAPPDVFSTAQSAAQGATRRRIGYGRDRKSTQGRVRQHDLANGVTIMLQERDTNHIVLVEARKVDNGLARTQRMTSVSDVATSKTMPRPGSGSSARSACSAASRSLVTATACPSSRAT